MQRLLIAAFLSAAAPLLAGCWHPAFRTAIENRTTQAIRVVIYFEDTATPPGHGPLAPGRSVRLTQAASDIRAVAYRVGPRWCRLDTAGIARAMQPAEHGVTRILLHACGEEGRGARRVRDTAGNRARSYL